ncbi:MAG: hypothetical protein Q3980_01110 [Turicibacter sp.]|nr:hypothetical protein [Turicibacter sp.]
MLTEENIKRKRRQKETMKKVRQTLINLILNSIGEEEGIVFADIKSVFGEFGLHHLSDASIRRDLDLAGIEYNGHYYVLRGMKEAQQTSLQLSKLIKDFDIFEPVCYRKVKQKNFIPLSLVHIYLRLKPDIESERISQFKELLKEYLNQVNNLYMEETQNYPLERYFFDVTESNQTLCFLINKNNSLNLFYELLTTISECDPTKSHKRVKLFHILPE